MNKSQIGNKEENIFSVFRRHHVSLSLGLSDGWANIEITKDHNGKEELQVKFLDDEGRGMIDESGDGGVPVEDVEKVAAFIRDLKSLRLENYTMAADEK